MTSKNANMPRVTHYDVFLKTQLNAVRLIRVTVGPPWVGAACNRARGDVTTVSGPRPLCVLCDACDVHPIKVIKISHVLLE